MIGGLVAIVVLSLAIVFLVIKIVRKRSSKQVDEIVILESSESGKNHTKFLKNDDLPQKLRWKIKVTFVNFFKNICFTRQGLFKR